MKVSDLVFGLMASQHKQQYAFADLRFLTAPFGVSEAVLRTSLSRMAAAKVIAVRREGRTASYSFGEKGSRIKSNVVHGFVALDWEAWDGAYWGVIFSVPDAHGETRHYIRKKLTKYRFACLSPGLWIRPAHPDEAIPEIFRNMLSSGYCRLIRFTSYDEFTPEQIMQMWNLREVNRLFGEGLALMEISEQKLSALSPAQALMERMTVGDAIVNTIFRDPMLPPQFLPADWQGEPIRERFRHFDSLAAAYARPYWEQIDTKEGAK